MAAIIAVFPLQVLSIKTYFRVLRIDSHLQLVYIPKYKKGKILKEEQLMRLANKIAFITGAGMGVGRATCLLFAAEGAKIVAAS